MFWHELSTEHNEPVRHGNLDTLLQQGTQVSLLRREMNHKWWKCVEVKQDAAEREVGLKGGAELLYIRIQHVYYSVTTTQPRMLYSKL